MPTDPTPLLVPVPRVAHELGVSESKVELMIRKGEITSVKVGRRRLVPYAAIVAYVELLQAS